MNGDGWMNDGDGIESNRNALRTCERCGSSNYDEHFDPLRVACNHCAHPLELELPTTPESRHREGALDLGFAALSTWIRGITAVASSPDTLLLEECPKCSNLLTVPDTTPLQLTCQSCGAVATVPIGDHVIDLIPEGRFSLQMRMGPGRYLDIRTETEHRILGLDDDAVCPACEAPLPPFEGEHRCGSCGSTIVAWSRCGRRFFPGMVIKGHINRQPLDGWYALSEVHRLLEEPLRGMEPLMDFFSQIPKIIAGLFLLVFGAVAGLFGLFWVLGLLTG